MRPQILLVVSLFLLTSCVNNQVPHVTGSDKPTTPTAAPITELPATTSPVEGTQIPDVEKTPAGMFLPVDGDKNLSHSTAQVESTDLFVLETYPIQVRVQIQGYLPTPCHKLRIVVNPPDAENRIYIDVYSVVNPDSMCIQMIESYDTIVDLGSFPTGHYTVYVNESLIGEFDS